MEEIKEIIIPEEEKSGIKKKPDEQKVQKGKKQQNSKRKEWQREKKKKKKQKSLNSNLLVDKKNTLFALKNQLEFYFSDSNLQKDNFLRNLIFSEESAENEEKKKNKNNIQEVDVHIILNFFRIKEILKDVESTEEKLVKVSEALSKSQLISYNSEEKRIVRKVPFTLKNFNKAETEKGMIYVENLPSSITHELLAAIFASTGKIMHISLPKFQNSKKPKGFAFIEFQVSFFHSFNNCIYSFSFRVQKLQKKPKRNSMD